MSARRILLAGLAGGVAMFVWASVAHMALPLGSTGVSQIEANEQPVLAQMQQTLGRKSGMYLFPAMDKGGSMQDYERKLAASPSGLLIYHPPGQPGMTAGQLLTEFLTELAQALLAAFLLAQTRLHGYGSRVAFVAAAGVLASLATNVSYWNWYGFPAAYTVAYMIIEIGGFLAAGLAIAALSKPQAAAAAA
jgi:hypothetical protein